MSRDLSTLGFWMERVRRLSAFKVRTLLAVLAFFSLALALVIQERRATKRELQLKKELAIARLAPYGYERRQSLLTGIGMVILEDASQAEVFRVAGSYQVAPKQPGKGRFLGEYPVALTGEVLGKQFVSRLSAELMDYRTYIYLGAFDDPNPYFGIRLWRGRESLDILFKFTDSHLDMWVFQRNGEGEVVHGNNGWMCVSSEALEKLAREAAPKRP